MAKGQIKGGSQELAEMRAVERERGMVMLAKIPVGAFFADWNGCVFRKAATLTVIKGRRVRHELECVSSAFRAGDSIGPVCLAFFCRPGDRVYREGALRVQPVLPRIEQQLTKETEV